MKYKILDGTIDGKHFVITIFAREEITRHLKLGLKRFFQAYETSKLKEKTKKESDYGYLSISSSSSSSGCRRK